jgi:hypothetical protein
MKRTRTDNRRQVHLAPEQIERAHALIPWMKGKHAQFDVTGAIVLRTAVDAGLDKLEAQAKGEGWLP